MTTVDVYIEAVRGPERLSLHNGLFGPATTLYSDVINAHRDGTAAGGWSGGSFVVTVSGRDLKRMLEKIDDLIGPYHDPEDNDRLRSFRDAISDTEDYRVKAIEF